jgi:polysaccharide export outer membrane protein
MRLGARALLACLVWIFSWTAHAQQGAAAPEKVPAPAAATNTSDSSYTIAPSDQLVITVWQEPSLSGDRLVRPDGKISMALLGDVQASGLTPMALANEITKDLQKYVKNPVVYVVVTHVHHNSAYLLGEVNKKGPIELTDGMTLLEAISTAGGLTDYAKKSKIYILRTVNGKQQRLQVNYKRALRGEAAFNIGIEPGDTIVVP